ncbi:hypothetical protein RQP46_009275 [Phenoliferia psychrophenolica]
MAYAERNFGFYLAFLLPTCVMVDEVRRGVMACKVFALYPLWWLSYNQINNNLTSQAAVMNTHGVPNDVINNLDPFALIILIPICDLFIYPALRRAGIGFSPIKKVTAGFFTASVAMVCAAVVQHEIYKQSDCGYHASTCDTVPNINVWAQTPSYVLIALSEIFASITALELAFTKAPKNMRSMVLMVRLLHTSQGEAFNPLVADPRIVWNYGVFAVCAFVRGFLFWFLFRKMDMAERELNEIGQGRTGGPAKTAGELEDGHSDHQSREKRSVKEDLA